MVEWEKVAHPSKFIKKSQKMGHPNTQGTAHVLKLYSTALLLY